MRADSVGAPVTPQQWDYIHEMGGALRSSLDNVTAVFAPSCIGHAVLTKRDWLNIKIDDISLAEALRCWELSTGKRNKNGSPNNPNGKQRRHNRNKRKKDEMMKDNALNSNGNLIPNKENPSDPSIIKHKLTKEERKRKRMNMTEEQKQMHRKNRNKMRNKNRKDNNCVSANPSPASDRSHNINRSSNENNSVNCFFNKNKRNETRSLHHHNDSNLRRHKVNHTDCNNNRNRKSQRHRRKSFIREPKKCSLRLLERCSWPQCNHSCPTLTNPLTGEEMRFLELLASFGLDIEAVATALGVDMQTLNNMDHTELVNLLTQQVS